MANTHRLLFATMSQAHYAELILTGDITHFGISETLTAQQQATAWQMTFQTEHQLNACDQRLLLNRAKKYVSAHFNTFPEHSQD